MKILIANWSCREAGGAEVYLSRLVPALAEKGHQVGFWCETEWPKEKRKIQLSPGAPCWCAKNMGQEAAFSAAKGFKPDLIFGHGFQKTFLEKQLLKLAPFIYFSHNYDGLCISGNRCHLFPKARSCSRIFDFFCIACYYPLRCGGLNPVTMQHVYQTAVQKKILLREYDAMIVASEYMRRILLWHGLYAERIFKVPLPIVQREDVLLENGKSRGESKPQDVWRICFLGRMDYLKGPKIMMKALPLIRQRLQRPVEAVFAGDGLMEKTLKEEAAHLKNQNLNIVFPGWIDEIERIKLFEKSHLLVVPSLWPEPFGMVGLEAGWQGLPVVAFRTGGILEWLENGVNGYCIPEEEDHVHGVAQAVVKLLSDEEAYQRMSLAAMEKARRFSMKQHLEALLPIFEKTLERNKKDPCQSNTNKGRLLMVSFIQNNLHSGMGKWSHRVAEGLRLQGWSVRQWFREDFFLTSKIGRLNVLLFPIILAFRIWWVHKYFDMVVIHEPSGFWYALLRKFFRQLPPLVLACHNVESKVYAKLTEAAEKGFANPVFISNIKPPLFRCWQSDWAIRMADGILCLSTIDASYIIKTLGCSPDRIIRINNGVLREELGMGPFVGGKRVLFVGGWLDVKGKYVLPRLWRQVREKIPEAQLTLVGTGCSQETLEADFDVRDRNSLRVFPCIEDPGHMKTIYTEHDALIIPSLSEGIPLSMLEAMATGLPVIASRVGGIPDVIYDGQNGLLYDSSQISEATAKICQLLLDQELAVRIKKAAYETISLLTWDNNIKPLDNFLGRVLSRAKEAKGATPCK